MKTVSILMVCTVNICRSPMAQGILQRLLKDEGVSDFISNRSRHKDRELENS